MADRHMRIGASEVAALMRLDPFQTRLDVYNNKVNPKESIAKPKGAMWYGLRLENAIMQMVYELLHADDCYGQAVYDTEKVLQATVDCVLNNAVYRTKKIPECIVEIKTSGFTGRSPESEDWGRAGTDQIPVRVMLQVQAQMLCASIPVAFIAKLSGDNGKGLQIYTCKKSKTIQEEILKVSTEFWNNHVLTCVPPDDR